MSADGFLIGVVVLALAVSVFTVFLRQYLPQYALLVSLGGSVIALLLALPKLTEITERLYELSEFVSGYEFAVLIKCVVLSVIGKTGADICRDAGQTALAGKVELCGNAAVIVAALPMFETVTKIIGRLIE